MATSDTNTDTLKGIPYNPAWLARGITQADYENSTPTAQATVAAAFDGLQSIASNAGHAITMQDALNAASLNSDIISKYSDALNLDTTQFKESLAAAQIQFSNTAQQQKIQFETDRKALAEASAAAGTAYSGFRQQAQNNLEETESGIVTSSRSAQQAQLDQLIQNFATKYGSAATPVASISAPNPLFTASVGIGGTTNQDATSDNTLTGNTPTLIGSQVATQKSDVATLADTFYKASATSPTVSP